MAGNTVLFEVGLKVLRMLYLKPEDLLGALFSEEISFEEFLELLGPVLANGTYGRIGEVSEALSGEDGVLDGLEAILAETDRGADAAQQARGLLAQLFSEVQDGRGDFRAAAAELLRALENGNRPIQQALADLRGTLRDFRDRDLAGLASVIRMARVDRLKTDHVHEAAERAGMGWADLHKSGRATDGAFRGWYECFLKYIQDADTPEEVVVQLCVAGGPIPDPRNPGQTAQYWHPEREELVDAVVPEPEPGQMAISWRDWRNLAQYIQSRRTLNSTTPSSIAYRAWSAKDAIEKGGLRGPSTTWEADGLEIYARLLEELLPVLQAFQGILDLLREEAQGKLAAASKLASAWERFTPGVCLRDRAEWISRLVCEPGADTNAAALAREQRDRQFAVNFALELLVRDQIWFIRSDLAEIMAAVGFAGLAAAAHTERGVQAVRPDAFVNLPLHDVGQAILEAVYEDETARMLAESRVEDPSAEWIVIDGAPALPGTVFAAVDGGLAHNGIDAAVRAGLWQHLPETDRREKLRRLRMAADQNAVSELRRAAHLGTPGWNDTARLDLGGGWLDREAERVELANAVGQKIVAELSQKLNAVWSVERMDEAPPDVVEDARVQLWKDYLGFKISKEALAAGLARLRALSFSPHGIARRALDFLDIRIQKPFGLEVDVGTMEIFFAAAGASLAVRFGASFGGAVMGAILGFIFAVKVVRGELMMSRSVIARFAALALTILALFIALSGCGITRLIPWPDWVPDPQVGPTLTPGATPIPFD